MEGEVNLKRDVLTIPEVLARVKPREINVPDKTVFMGSGSSFHVALYAKYIYLSRGVWCDARDTGSYGIGPVKSAVVISVSGGKDAVKMAKWAKEKGAYVSLITCNKNALASEVADDVHFVTEREGGFVNTRTIVAMMYYIAGAAGVKGLDTLPQVIEERFKAESTFISTLAGKTPGRPVWFVGGGYTYVAALQAALKLREVTGVLTCPVSFEEFFHGRVFHRDNSLFVLINRHGGVEKFLSEAGLEYYALECRLNGPLSTIEALSLLYLLVEEVRVKLGVKSMPLLNLAKKYAGWRV